MLWIPLVRRTREPFGAYVGAARRLAARPTRSSTTPPPARCARRRGSPRPTSSSSTPSATSTARPARRVVSVVYWALVQSDEAEQRGRRRERAAGSPADDLPELAFDHNRDRRLRPLAPAHQARVRRASRTPSSARPSPSPSCARCTRPCCSAARPGELPPHDRGAPARSSPPTSTSRARRTARPRLYRYRLHRRPRRPRPARPSHPLRGRP